MIETYSELKAYITQYVQSDPRIPAKGFIWGMSKRVLDAMASAPVYPYFWVENVSYHAEGYDSNTQISGMWDLEISVKGNSMLGDVPQQEYWLNHTHQIMKDFIGFLMDQHNEGRIYFNLSRFQATMKEVYEPDDSFGWSFSVQLGYVADSWCALPAADSYEVTTLLPVFEEEAGLLSVGIDVATFTQAWTSEADKAYVLNVLADQISLTSTAVTATTDGVYLYLKAKVLGATVSYTLTFPGEHSWEQNFA